MCVCACVNKGNICKYLCVKEKEKTRVCSYKLVPKYPNFLPSEHEAPLSVFGYVTCSVF